MKLTASKILTNKFRNYRINENLTQTDIKETYWYLVIQADEVSLYENSFIILSANIYLSII